METQVIFRERQQLLSEDFINIQAYTQASLDAIVAAALVGRTVYDGFQAAKSGTSTVTIAAGRCFAGSGAVYARQADTTRDFIGQLPQNAKRKVAVVTYGVTEDTGVEQRKFRVNAVTNQVEADDVAMRRARSAQIAFLLGAESADPQLPAIDASQIHVATITLSQLGVEAVEMVAENALANLADIAAAVDDHKRLLAVFEGLFVTLRSDMSALAEKQRLLASSGDVQALQVDVARLRARAGISSSAVAVGANLFLDETGSDKTYAGYAASIFGGLRFPTAASSSAALQLFNPNDPAVRVDNGFCLPAYDVEARVTIDGYAGDLALANYQSQTVEMVQLTRTRERVVYGETSNVVVNLNDPSYDRLAKTYARDGETLQVDAEWYSGGGQAMIALRPKSTTITESEPYWDAVTTSSTVQGSTLGQSYLNAQAGYTLGVDVFFTDLAATGDVHAHLVECDVAGMPNMARGVAKVTKAAADLKRYPAATSFGVPPTVLSPGKRYAWVFVSQGAHRMAVADKNRYAAGQLFSSTDGAFFSAAGDKDLLMVVKFARFRASRVVVQLQPIQLAGGISDLDLLYEAVREAGTDLVLEIQPQGLSTWYQVGGDDTASGLASLPAALNARLTFVGSPDMMPGIKLSDSIVRAFRRSTALNHTSKVLARATTSTIKYTAYLRGFNAAAPANHTCVAKILIGGVTELHDLVTDEVVPAIGADPGGIKRTWTFNIASPTSSYRTQLLGTTADGRNTFTITEAIDQAL
ncbi:hypothetical protein [Caulobacter segnis]|uniref:Uncharacterized protein n=1 Tax=Caulobacter segnis TaxID=88688 RepID=A0A2W5VBA4_9CAUL|nr:hypothetical protein [Caulobacter segnis]PZR37179.1 MAG: hypothetical protein DI526_01295 [Caulobacter segnis]